MITDMTPSRRVSEPPRAVFRYAAPPARGRHRLLVLLGISVSLAVVAVFLFGR